MAGVLEQIRRPRRKLVKVSVPLTEMNPKVLELQAAKEILAEVFGTNMSEIEEVLKLRCEERLEVGGTYSRRKRTQGEPLLKHPNREMQAWPMEFCLAEESA